MKMTLLQAIDDPALFKPWFKNPKDWLAWRTFIAALFGLRMDAEQRAIFTACTGRTTPPTKPSKEAWLVVGRRGGKSFTLALIAVFMACFVDYRKHLVPGERGVILILAANTTQGGVIFRYIAALLNDVPMLKALVERETADTFDLTNRITIKIAAASFRTVRGHTLVAALCDELAFWWTDDSANPDYEILAALRPAQATIPNAMLLCASSPYAKRGALWDAFNRYYGQDTPILVWKAATQVMNPSVDPDIIAAAQRDDPANAAAEYGAEFRSDLETFVSPEVVAAAVVSGRFELAPTDGVHYFGFSDAAGGSGGDSFTASVAHLDRTGKVVLDAARESTPPFSPEAAIADLSRFFKTYRVRKITADRWGGEFPVEQFRKFGITCEPSDLTKSEIYRDFLPLLNSRRIELLDNARLTKQLCALERRTARGGRDSIDHPPGAHDDLINAVAGAAVLAGMTRPPMTISREALALSRAPTPWARPARTNATFT